MQYNNNRTWTVTAFRFIYVHLQSSTPLLRLPRQPNCDCVSIMNDYIEPRRGLSGITYSFMEVGSIGSRVDDTSTDEPVTESFGLLAVRVALKSVAPK